jgi:hypothetical protein
MGQGWILECLVASGVLAFVFIACLLWLDLKKERGCVPDGDDGAPHVPTAYVATRPPPVAWYPLVQRIRGVALAGFLLLFLVVFVGAMCE